MSNDFENNDNLDKYAPKVEKDTENLHTDQIADDSPDSDDPKLKHNSQSIDYSAAPFAGFWLRVFANCIDAIFVGILNQLIFMVFLNDLSQAFLEYGFFNFWMLPYIIGLIPTSIFYVLPTHFYGKTIGKKIMGLRVIDSHNSGNLSLLKSLIRETIGKLLSAAFLAVGFLMVAFHKEKAGLHDLLIDSRVIKERR